MRKKKKIIIITFIILIMLIFVFKSIKYIFLQEDLIFFQLLNSEKKSNNLTKNDSNVTQEISDSRKLNSKNLSMKQFTFDVEFKNTKFKDINLYETINQKTLVYEKIAPGTAGNFDIILDSNKKLNYMIQFESKNEKPLNLKFYLSGDETKYDTLEELDDILTGVVSKNEEKVICINWEWCYENDKENNIRDTNDAKEIREYNFLIYVQGY